MRILYFLFAITLFSCQSSNEQNENIKTNDSIVSRDIIIEGSRIDTPPPPPPPPLTKTFKGAGMIREGSHQFTLHWISWDQPGKVMIKQVGDSLYSVNGKQTSPKNDDYVTIDGTFYSFSKTELIFEGTVVTQVETINGGKPCTRKGPITFFAKGNRQYWRMQEMANCEGGGLVDYVDVYFK